MLSPGVRRRATRRRAVGSLLIVWALAGLLVLARPSEVTTAAFALVSCYAWGLVVAVTLWMWATSPGASDAASRDERAARFTQIQPVMTAIGAMEALAIILGAVLLVSWILSGATGL